MICVISMQITRSEQLSQQLQKELANQKQKNKSEVRKYFSSFSENAASF